MSKRTQPEWSSPKPAGDGDLPNLKLFNSLTLNKETFVPHSGKKVLWYCCGPTVYDDSHMGHAMSYITFDILRRVFKDYFKFDVQYVMNITDIDDKIIKRARQNYLHAQYCKQTRTVEELRKDIAEALERTRAKFAKETDKDKKNMLQEELQKVTSALANPEASMDNLMAAGRDALSDWLDSSLGSSVTENSIFESLPRRFEEEFHRDMAALNVLPADQLTRVSEYVDKIVIYIEKILANGFAYESAGSVYFDTGKFATSPGHFYAKLVPTAYGDQAMLAEGEGDLSISADRLQEKRSTTDFALWKASKPGEPAWPSPWGPGRPGWHIECSVMASDILGPTLDIHTGGYDLKFPHHDNEMAQAEAYYDNHQWVNYFLHAGHLTIKGCKMSKSLKNFVTIRDALRQHSARRLRLAFLQHAWKDTLDYSPDTMAEAVNFEKMIVDFLFTVSHVIRQHEVGAVQPPRDAPSSAPDVTLTTAISTATTAVDTALRDSVDTPRAMLAIRDLVNQSNLYLRECGASSSVNSALLLEVARFVIRLLRLFGAAHGEVEQPACSDWLSLDPVPVSLGNQIAQVMRAADQFVEGVKKEVAQPGHQAILDLCSNYATELQSKFGIVLADADKFHGDVQVATATAVLLHLANFRESVRRDARAGRLSAVLAQCDRLRDQLLPEVGVQLQDREDGMPAIGWVDRAILVEEAREKAKNEEARRAAKQAQKQEQEAQARIPPEKLFTGQTDKYSKFDEKGMPTHDVDGKEVSKAQLKKLQKLYDVQAKRYADYRSKIGGADLVANGNS